MTQNDKDLMLKDLCARLPYGVKIYLEDFPRATLAGIVNGDIILHDDKYGYTDEIPWDIMYIKPYLFPLSSMTEEQKEEYVSLQQRVIYNSQGLVNLDVMEYTAWCYNNHIDINGLIPMGLALDATGLNIY
jgi:hypothetical protein